MILNTSNNVIMSSLCADKYCGSIHVDVPNFRSTVPVVFGCTSVSTLYKNWSSVLQSRQTKEGTT